MPISQTHIMVGQPGISRDDKDYLALYVGNHILGGSGFSSQLMQVIREDRGLAYDARSQFIPMQVAGPFFASVKTRNETADEARKLLIETIANFCKSGPTEKELDHAIKNITGSFPLNIDSNGDLIGYLGAIGFYDLPLDYLQSFTEEVRAVTAEQIRDAFQRRIKPGEFLTIIVGGNAEAGE